MNAEAELIVRDRRALSVPDAPPAPVAAPAGPVTPMYLLQIATAQGADLQRLEQLMALQERWEANEARKQFVAAMAAFKADPPMIVKNKHVRFATSKGVTEYHHATHDEVTNKIAAGLAKYGLSHRWHVEQLQGGRVRVTCSLTHAAGHVEAVTMEASPDESGSKNSIQAVGSTVTYLQRYTLLSITGLSTAEIGEADDDGRAGGVQPKRITEEQVANLEALITEVGANRVQFLKFCRVEQLEDLLAEHYSRAVRALEDRRSQQK